MKHRRKRRCTTPQSAEFVSVVGISIEQWADEHGFNPSVVQAQLARGYCAWPRRRARSGNTSHDLYSIWAGMWTRCTNYSEPAWLHYGGRGISVCGRWVHFRNFVEDMGPRPSPEYSLDRIDVDGNYAPENCRWALWSTQIHNRREVKRKGKYRGVHETRPGIWRATAALNGKRVHLGYYRNPHRAAAAFNRHAIRTYGAAAVLNDIRKEVHERT